MQVSVSVAVYFGIFGTRFDMNTKSSVTIKRSDNRGFVRIGNNLNQLMRYFHQNGANTTGIENDIRCCIRQIYDMSAKLDNIEVSDNGNP